MRFEGQVGLVTGASLGIGRATAIALARGGACETVDDGVTGLLVRDDSQTAFADAIRRLDDTAFDPTVLQKSASRFSRCRFQTEMRAAVEALAGDVQP